MENANHAEQPVILKFEKSQNRKVPPKNAPENALRKCPKGISRVAVFRALPEALPGALLRGTLGGHTPGALPKALRGLKFRPFFGEARVLVFTPYGLTASLSSAKFSRILETLRPNLPSITQAAHLS